MSKRRSLFFIVVGLLLGSLLTALLFSLCNDPSQERKVPGEKDSDETKEAAIDPKDDSLQGNLTTERNLTGDCVLSGSVQAPDESPLAGATVGLRLLDEPWATANIDITDETDSSGAFEISGLTEDAEYQIWAWAPGYAVASYENAQCGTKTHLTLESGSSMNLSFVTPEGNEAGPVSVQIAGSSLWPARQAVTDNNSKLILHGLSPGFFSINASTGKYSFSLLEPIELKAGETTELEIQLTLSRAATIRVKDAHSGKPLVEATVISHPLNSPLLQRVQTTDSNGEAVLPSPSAAGDSVSVLAPRYVQPSPRQILPGGEESFNLLKGASVQGVVTTTQGNPVSGAFPELDVELGTIFTTVPSGPQRIFQRDIFAASMDGWPKVIPISDFTAIAGPDNLPLPSVGDESTQENQSSIWRPTNLAGEFEMDGLPAGHFSIGASHPEFILDQAAQVTLEAGKTQSGLKIVMRPGNILSLRTVNRSGFPVRGAVVVIYDVDARIIATGESQPDGFCEFKGLPTDYRVEATADRFVPAATKVNASKTSRTEVVLKLPEAGESLRGRITNENGYGVSGATITARAITRGLVQVLITETEKDGTFRLDGAGRGSYHVTAEIDGRVKAQVGDASFDREINLVVNPSHESPLYEGEQAFVTPEDLAHALGGPQLPLYEEPEDFDSEGEPGLGIVAISETQENQGSVNTEYGQADTLIVTGPPSGKGGLPITIGGSVGNIRVQSVMPGSMVAGAGLKAGDKILSIDGAKVNSPANARRAISGKIGSVIIIEVVHKGERISVVVQRVRVAH